MRRLLYRLRTSRRRCRRSSGRSWNTRGTSKASHITNGTISQERGGFMKRRFFALIRMTVLYCLIATNASAALDSNERRQFMQTLPLSIGETATITVVDIQGNEG